MLHIVRCLLRYFSVTSVYSSSSSLVQEAQSMWLIVRMIAMQRPLLPRLQLQRCTVDQSGLQLHDPVLPIDQLHPAILPMTLLALILLQHSFYFYFYFEHLNITRSYLIDMKISWSLDHIDLISWSYLGDLISRSTILSWSLDLIIWWWSKICFFI